MRDHLPSASPFGALAVLATARAALGAAVSIDRRRGGRDASAQEQESVARRDLGELAERLTAHALRLRVRGATAGDTTSTAALAMAFEDHVLLGDLAETAGLAHQKLLSLYPAIEPELAEAARRLARDAESLAGSDGAAAPERLADPAAQLADAIRDALT